MSKVSRPTKWRSRSTACAGQISAPVQRRTESTPPPASCSRTASEPQNGTFGREPVWLRAGRALLEDDVDDLRDHVAGALDDDGVADADVLAVADRLTVIADAGDVVLVVQRRVLHHDAADCHRP